ncbi:MAG: type II secretion system protein GspK [Candidatus Omnitrophota bacterium]|nr:type II secretion system protein GspK [Candidatus Omnitrophota bacterium]
MNRGSLLIVTLWIVTILGALSVAVARYLSTEVRLTRYRLARFEARELARSGVLLAQHMIFLDDPQVDWGEESWAKPLRLQPVEGRTTLTVTITDEERKLNVNTATLVQLASRLGDAPAQAITNYLHDKDAPIAVLHELSDLKDLDETVHDLLAAHATPYTGTVQNGGPLNINTATREAMIAYGLSEDTVEMIDSFRTNTQFERPVDIVPTLQGLGWDITDPVKAGEELLLSSMVTASSFFLVVTEGVVEQPAVRVRIQAVLERSAGGATPKILAWQEL